jgi:hypothetical protein
MSFLWGGSDNVSDGRPPDSEISAANSIIQVAQLGILYFPYIMVTSYF